MNYEALLRAEGMPAELPLLVDQAHEQIDAGLLPAYEPHEQKLVGVAVLEQNTAVDRFFNHDLRGEYEFKSGESVIDRLEDETQSEDTYYGGSPEVYALLVPPGTLLSHEVANQHRDGTGARAH